MRTKRIIAIFGGSGAASAQVLACAKELGRAVAAGGHVLLTGGTRPGDKSVKAIAIDGAGSARWVGVSRDGPPRVEERAGGLVIWTELGHKRNYLEAFMSDAAIALPGGDGTVSEVTSSLSLGRPVAFVGEWRTDIDLDACDRSFVLKKIVERTRSRFGNPTGSDGINALIAEDALLRALDRLPPYRYFNFCEAEAVVQWIESVVRVPAAHTGELHRIAGLKEVARDYERWLAQHDV